MTVLPRRLEVEDEVADFARAGGIDAGGGFVEHEQARVVDEGLGQADALEHALGISCQAAVGGFFQSDHVEQFLDPRGQGLPVKPQSLP